VFSPLPLSEILRRYRHIEETPRTEEEEFPALETRPMPGHAWGKGSNEIRLLDRRQF
jgi:hypothetical protein